MNLGILSSTRCIAVAFQPEFVLAVNNHNVYDVFKSFLNVNIANSNNPYLSQALKKCLLLGHIEPFVILIGGDEASLRTLKSCWMRAQLQPPPGFRIESIGDAGGLILNSVPQYASMRLEEVILQVICQVSALGPTCSESRLYGNLVNIYTEMQSQLPPRQAVYSAISSLIKSGLIYYCGQGYNIMTPDKMNVVNWLRSLPATDDHIGGGEFRPPSRLEVSKASLVLNQTSSASNCAQPQSQMLKPQNSAFSRRLSPSGDEGPSLRSSDSQEPILFPSVSPQDNNPKRSHANKSFVNQLQPQFSHLLKRDAYSSNRLSNLRNHGSTSTSSPSGGIAYPHPQERDLVSPRGVGGGGDGISASTSFNTSLQEQLQPRNRSHQSQQQLPGIVRTSNKEFSKRRTQISQSFYLNSIEPGNRSPNRFGRPLGEQRSSRFTKSADFQSMNMTKFGGHDSQLFRPGVLKKRGSNTLLQWFKSGFRKLRNSLRRSLSRDNEWPAQSMPSFPMFYQNTSTANVNPISPTIREHRRHAPWGFKAQRKSRSQTIMTRGSSGDVYPFHNVLSSGEYDRESSISNLRRCLSLAENQHRDQALDGGNAAPFSMEVIPESELQTTSQNIDSSPYMRRDSTLEQIFAWQQGAASMLSLNATPNGLDRSSQSDSRQVFPESVGSRGNISRGNNANNNSSYMARSGRDSGFIDIPSHPNFAQMDSSAYSVIHSHQHSEPQAQEASDLKELTDAFEDLASGALKGSGPLLQVPPTAQQFRGLGMNRWWSGGFSGSQQIQNDLQSEENLKATDGNAGLCANWNIYQNSGEMHSLQAN